MKEKAPVPVGAFSVGIGVGEGSLRAANRRLIDLGDDPGNAGGANDASVDTGSRTRLETRTRRHSRTADNTRTYHGKIPTRSRTLGQCSKLLGRRVSRR